MTKQEIIAQLKAIASDCERMTPGNVSHIAPQIRGQVEMLAECLKKQPKEKRTELDWSLVPGLFVPVMQTWITYKKEKNQSYKQSGFELCCKKLIQLSGGNVQIAEQIVYQSMANNYSGLFPLKNERTYNNTKRGATAIFDAAETILRKG